MDQTRLRMVSRFVGVLPPMRWCRGGEFEKKGAHVGCILRKEGHHLSNEMISFRLYGLAERFGDCLRHGDVECCHAKHD